MKIFMLLAFMVFTHGAGAQTIDEKIHSIVRGKDGEPHLVKYQSGLVKFIEHTEKDKLASLEKKLNSQSAGVEKLFLQPEGDFTPSIVNDGDMQSIFSRLNKFMKRKSECSDRAHVWAYDEFQATGIRSEKVFLLLTDAYIRRTRFKWWFHVAPMFTTASGQKMVTDAQFIDHPVTFTEWKNHLVFSNRECVTDFQFLDYNAGADQSQDCYVKFEPMYYRIPGDIGNREKGQPRTSWNTSEVNASRARAFFKGSIR